MVALSTFQAMLWATAAYGFIFWGGMLHAVKEAFGSVVAVLATSLLFCVYHFATFALAPPTAEFLLKTFVGGLMLAIFTILSQCVLPALIVHQLAQFFHFATLQDNPFAEDLDRFVPTLIMLLVLCGIYERLVKLTGRAGKGGGSLRKGKEGGVSA
jgi:membrane protease YdiL (CAAX protease family)